MLSLTRLGMAVCSANFRQSQRAGDEICGVAGLSSRWIGEQLCVIFVRCGFLDVDDFEFEAAVLGVFVFAQAVGDMDEEVFLQAEGGDALGPVPAERGETSAARPLREIEADMLLLERADGAGEADVARDEDGLLIAHAEGLQAAEPGEECRRDVVERQLGVAGDGTAEVFFSDARLSVFEEMGAQRGDAIGRHGKADGVGVAAEAGEEMGTALDGLEQVVALDGAARACSL